MRRRDGLRRLIATAGARSGSDFPSLDHCGRRPTRAQIKGEDSWTGVDAEAEAQKKLADYIEQYTGLLTEAPSLSEIATFGDLWTRSAL